MKILLVEDEKLLFASIKMVLEENGYTCETAYTLREAEDRLYDLVVLDLNLPGGLGSELFEYIKAMETRPGVLIISARNGLFYPAYDTLAWPVAPSRTRFRPAATA